VETGLNVRGNFTSQTDLDAFYAQVNEADDYLQRFASQCVLRSPNTLRYVGTAATVRDMVAMHDVLESSDKAIDYWGVSYGTVLGMYFVNSESEIYSWFGVSSSDNETASVSGQSWTCRTRRSR
jgi:hypothetical protein